MTPQLNQVTGQNTDHLINDCEIEAQLTQPTLENFKALTSCAKKSGIDIQVVSSHRSFEKQLRIWNEKYSGKRPILSQKGAIMDGAKLSAQERVNAILIWTALPGISRHHWGTDLDIIDKDKVQNGYSVQLVPEEFSRGGIFSNLDIWLEQHLTQFGFFRPYRGIQSGFQAEPWHISSIKESERFFSMLTFERLASLLSKTDILGKKEILELLPDLYRQYVLSIDPPP